SCDNLTAIVRRSDDQAARQWRTFPCFPGWRSSYSTQGAKECSQRNRAGAAELTVCQGRFTLTNPTVCKTHATCFSVTNRRYQWAAVGDANAFFGLMLDNVAGLILTVGLLAGVFEFPTEFALSYMVPGTAVGVLVGDLPFFWMAFALARRTGRTDVKAMPLGLDTPSTF